MLLLPIKQSYKTIVLPSSGHRPAAPQSSRLSRPKSKITDELSWEISVSAEISVSRGYPPLSPQPGERVEGRAEAEEGEARKGVGNHSSRFQMRKLRLSRRKPAQE